MNLVELDRALRQLRLSGMAAVLETRLRQAQTEKVTPIDLVSMLVSDELLRRQDRLLERRVGEFLEERVGFAIDDAIALLDHAVADGLGQMTFPGPGWAQKERVFPLRDEAAGCQLVDQRAVHLLVEIEIEGIERASGIAKARQFVATLDGTRKIYLAELAAVPLLIIDDLGMRKLPHTAAEDLLEIIIRRYERASTLLTSNRPVDDWGKLLGDTAAVTALLDRLLHHAHILKCGPRSWRTKIQTDLRTDEATK